jgi:MoaA/NifB/PqqE/SkfB family radical SAM enzyme
MKYSVDIEVTNRCNAKCHFCPRDRTPHQGLMQPDVFDLSLERALEYRKVCNDLLDTDLGVSLCGLGEPLLNKHVVDYTRQVREAGLDVTMSSNASLLDEDRGRALLDAGLQKIFVNIGEQGDDYEEVYGLPWERTLENIVRFNELSAGACEITMVLVDHRSDPDHIARMEKFWAGHGLHMSVSYEVMNRGGSLFVDHMQYESFDELREARRLLAANVGIPVCGAPFAFLFIGYDGQYYLCCSDWEKQAPMGHVSDLSFLEVTEAKLRHVASREPVCRTCNLDSVNRLTEALRAENEGIAPAGSADAELAQLTKDNAVVEDLVGRLGYTIPEPTSAPRRLIPIRTV